MKVSIPRLRRVRFKDGRTIDVLRTKPTDDQHLRDSLNKAVKYSLDIPHPLGGYALVVWQADNTSVAYLQSNGNLPAVLVPDFVRNRLLALKIEDWTIDTLNGN